jgi:LysM repeat protein
METPQQSAAARLAAIVALVAAFVVCAVILLSTVGGGRSDQQGDRGSARATTGKPQRRVYVVKPGDTLSLIAQKVGVSVERLQRLNPDLDQFSLQSGDRVKLR